MAKLRVYARDEAGIDDELRARAERRTAEFAQGLPKVAFRAGLQTLGVDTVAEAVRNHRRGAESDLKAVLSEAAREQEALWADDEVGENT